MCKVNPKVLLFKRGLRSSQRLVNEVLCSRILSLFLLACHTRNDLSVEAKSFPTKDSSSKELPNGMCGEQNTRIYLSLSSFWAMFCDKKSEL